MNYFFLPNINIQNVSYRDFNNTWLCVTLKTYGYGNHFFSLFLMAKVSLSLTSMVIFGLNKPQDGRVHRVFARNTQCWTRFLPGFQKSRIRKHFLSPICARAASPPIKRHRLLWAWQEDFSRRAGFFFFFFRFVCPSASLWRHQIAVVSPRLSKISIPRWQLEVWLKKKWNK